MPNVCPGENSPKEFDPNGRSNSVNEISNTMCIYTLTSSSNRHCTAHLINKPSGETITLGNIALL